MSLEQTDKIDYVGVDRATGEVVLTIADEMDWRDEERHLRTLQEKINSYLRFYESGEIYEAYPPVKGRKAAILIMGKYPLTAHGEAFLSEVKRALMEAGVDVRFEWFPGKPASGPQGA